jgi:hypothetical protein
MSREATPHPGVRWLRARGPLGELHFRLQYARAGLHVEREEIPVDGPHCVLSMHFQNPQHFEQWCDGDSARFEHPLLHLALKRDASALWLEGPVDG